MPKLVPELAQNSSELAVVTTLTFDIDFYWQMKRLGLEKKGCCTLVKKSYNNSAGTK